MNACPNCRNEVGGDEKFCPFCGYEFEEKDIPDASLTQQVFSGGQGPEMTLKVIFEQDDINVVKSFECPFCGAKVEYDPATRIQTCAYCGSQMIIEGYSGDNNSQPQGIIPFVVDENRAQELFRKWMGSKFPRFGDFSNKNVVGKLRGVYIPYWIFDVDVCSNWNAEAGYDSYDWETQDSSGNPDDAAKAESHIRWESVSGQHSSRYEDIMINASIISEEYDLGSILSSPLNLMRPYNPNFLAGRSVEKAEISVDEAMNELQKLLYEREVEECRRMVPGESHRNLRVGWEKIDWSHQLILVPVWTAACRYKDKTYRFLANGVTGAVAGEAPKQNMSGCGCVSFLILVVLVGIMARYTYMLMTM